MHLDIILRVVRVLLLATSGLTLSPTWLFFVLDQGSPTRFKGLKTWLRQGLSLYEFYCDHVASCDGYLDYVNLFPLEGFQNFSNRL